VLPGASLVLVLLALNLTTGGLVRIRKCRATAGVIVTHLGILLLLGAGLARKHWSEEGQLTLLPGQSSDEFQSVDEWEVAIFDASQRTGVKEWLIPAADVLALQGAATRVFESPDLPFRLTLGSAEPNCRVMPWRAEAPVRPVVDGFLLEPAPLDKEVERNVPGGYAVAEDERSGLRHDGILFGLARSPWSFESGGKTWGVDLRRRRHKMPFSITLDRFGHESYPRTEIAKVYESDVRVTDQGGSRPVRIAMNEPLRHDGLVVYQAAWGTVDTTPGAPVFSTFAVVRNPSDTWPLYACLVIAAGMILTFVPRLVRHVQAQRLLTAHPGAGR
jgi:hypothetical protein